VKSVTRLGVAFIGCALFSLPASAYRFEFITMVGSERLTGSEVCLYKGLDLHGPASMFLASDDVRCFPADQLIDVPQGVWAFYARHPDGWISAHGSAIRRGETARRHQGYRSLQIDLERSAFVSFDGMPASADRFAVYVPISGDPRHAPAAFPLPAGEKRIIVPAGRPFLVLRIRDGHPVGAGPLTTLEPGQTADGAGLAPAPGQRDLIGWIRLDDASVPEMENVEAPVVRLFDANGVEHMPLFDIAGAGASHKSLVVFSRVPSGNLSLQLRGKDWKTTNLPLNVLERAPGRFLEAPLVARLRQRVTVEWSLPASVPEFPGYPESCADAALATPREWSLQLLSCPQWQPSTPPERLDLSRCEVKREETVEPSRAGRVSFDLLTPGSHVAVLYAGRFRLGIAPAISTRDADSRVVLPIRVPALFGRVSEAGQPVKALLRFATGSAVTDDAGYYRTMLERDPLDNVVEVIPCDGSPTYEDIPTSPIVGSGQYDIEIPGNRIDVTVVDARDGKPVRQATIARGLFETEADAKEAVLEGGGGEPVDEKGSAVLRRLLPGYYLRICASADGYYPTSCAEPIKLTADTAAERTISLQRRALRRGRLLISAPIVGGTLYRTMPTGEIVETIPIEKDGTFAYTGERAAEYLVAASHNYPLFLVPHPPLPEEGELEIAVPLGAIRSFTVLVSESYPHRSGFFTIGVGEARVPRVAFDNHLTRRGLSGDIYDGGPARVVDVIETAPLHVVAALGDFQAVGNVEDRFLMPQYAPFLQILPVPQDGVVLLGR
jgi:hypothetical protein